DLSPSHVVAETLDPVFDQALGPVKELLDLPQQLGTLLHDTGETLKGALPADLERVEQAFDKMLKAIPLDGGGGGDGPSGPRGGGSGSGPVGGSVQLGAA